MKPCLLLPLFLASTACLCAQEQVTLILHGGKIFTADEMLSMASAVALRGDHIVAVGGEELLHRYRSENLINLNGRFVVPGFNDSHIHVSGTHRRDVQLSGVKSIGEIKQAVRTKAGELGPGQWITGYGWAEGMLLEQRMPHRKDLDEATPQNPMVLARAGGHSAVANSLALRQAGITRDTPNPEGGIIEHDADGEPSGIIRERQDVVYRLVPPATAEELRPSFVNNLRDLLRLGITSIIQAGVGPAQYEEWLRVYRLHGSELPRAAVQIAPGLRSGGVGVEEAMRRLKDFGRITGDGDDRLRVGAVKIFVDGGFAGPAAWTLKPYRGQPDYYGIQNVSEEDLYTLVKWAHERKWQMGFHTIGDAAIKLAVDVFARVIAESPRRDHRHYLNHFTVLPPWETMRKMALSNILVSQQPNFTYAPTLESRYVENLEGERLERNNALRSVTRHGIFMALASDIQPIGPMVGLYASVTRRGSSGRIYAEDERLTMPEAIAAYTRNGAYLSFEEKTKGTIEPGKLADLR